MTEPALRVHGRGASPRLDALLELTALVARPRLLKAALEELPRRIAAALRCESCGIYVLEGDELVLHGGTGDEVRQRVAVGEGVVGLAAEGMRPISAVGGAGEWAAVPMAGPYGLVGALALGRQGLPFSVEEIELAVALTAPVAAVLERAHLIAALSGLPRGAAARSVATRRMTLPGRAINAGRAVGTVSALYRPSLTGSSSAAPAGDPAGTLSAALSAVRRTLDELAGRAGALGREAGFLEPFRLMLDDARLKERVLELVAKGEPLPRALTRAGAEATRAADRTRDPYGLERALALHDLCEALAVLVAEEQPAIPRDAVLVGDQITLFDLLVSVRRQPAAVVLASPATPATATLLLLVGVPTVADVPSLFRWVSEGDLVLVDGDAGQVRVNPGRDEVAAVRAGRRLRDES